MQLPIDERGNPVFVENLLGYLLYLGWRDGIDIWWSIYQMILLLIFRHLTNGLTEYGNFSIMTARKKLRQKVACC